MDNSPFSPRIVFNYQRVYVFTFFWYSKYSGFVGTPHCCWGWSPYLLNRTIMNYLCLCWFSRLIHFPFNVGTSSISWLHSQVSMAQRVPKEPHSKSMLAEQSWTIPIRVGECARHFWGLYMLISIAHMFDGSICRGKEMVRFEGILSSWMIPDISWYNK